MIDAVFGSQADAVQARAALTAWEKAGDPRLFKFIISPEFGERVDHRRLTRELFGHIERDLGVRLEWVAVTHFNTDHPHTHVALRGVTAAGRELRFSRQYLSHTIRQHAQAEITRQLGYRTQLDMARAARREVGQTRFTNLDRQLLAAESHLPASNGWRPIGPLPTRAQRTQLVQRLETLEAMGYARKSLGTWYVAENLRAALMALQRATDRQRALRAGHLPVSDSRLPLVVTPSTRLQGLEGRILGHGEEEGSGKRYMLLESIDGKVHYIYHNNQMASFRQRHELKPGHYVAFNTAWQTAGGRWRGVLEVRDLGDAERLLADAHYLRQAMPVQAQAPVFGGWLGRRNAAVREFQQSAAPLRHRPIIKER